MRKISGRASTAACDVLVHEAVQGLVFGAAGGARLLAEAPIQVEVLQLAQLDLGRLAACRR